MSLETRRCKTYETTSPSGEVDGTWMKLLTTGDGQINLVTVPPNVLQGVYIHGERSEWHICIRGKVLIWQPTGQTIATSENNPIAVLIPSLTAHGILNASDQEATLIIISDLPHDVTDDEYPLPVSTEEVESLLLIWKHEYEF